jgi:hypothetical protein
MRWSAILVIVALLISGCDGPRSTMVPKTEARRDERVMRLQVVKVYDNSNREFTREFNVSHVIDVDVLDGPPEVIGSSMALPYDLFYVAKPPPQEGDIVVTTPAAWVTRSPTGKQRGFGQ